MKNLILLALIAVVIFTVSCSKKGNASQRTDKPKIEFLEKEYDFGPSKQGDKLEHNFVFFNKGSDTLRIQHVEGSCSCTATLLSKSVLAPGDSGSIHVKLNTKMFVGKIRREVDVFCNDSTEWPQTLFIQTTIAKENK